METIKTIILWIVGVIAFVWVLGLAGKSDYDDHVREVKRAQEIRAYYGIE